MPLFETTDQKEKTNPNSSLEKPPKEESGIIKTIGQLLPFAPLVFEQFTGQKLPAMSGTMAEIQLALTQIVQNQQQLAQRIVNLETNASQQLNNLTQSFQSFRLTHTREKKEIELHSNASDFN